MAGLSDGKLVMTWRAVSDLQNVKSGVPKTANWPEIGQNSYAIVYDAGTMIVGYWVQKALFQKLADKRQVTILRCQCEGALSLQIQTKLS